MRRLECGCELSPTGGLVSLCEIHGANAKQVQATAKLDAARTLDRQKQWQLAVAIAPEVVRDGLLREAKPTDTAGAVLDHVNEILRRLD